MADALARGLALDEALERQPGGEEPLARAIAVTTFRRLGTIRRAVGERLAKGWPADPAAGALFATGAAQILFLDIPDHAAVDLAVRLAQGNPGTRHLAPVANAVLRRLARERDRILAERDPLADMPEWLLARWRPLYGPDRVGAFAEAHRAGAPLDLTCRTDPAGWAARLGGTVLPTGSVRLTERTAVAALPGYEEGGWWVQDAAAALPARMLAVRPGERILDLCAAPGGKTAQLAAAGASVTALDRSESRLERLRANMDRLGLTVEVVCADALAYSAEPFDAVLLDAPCTATGTIRRHPEIAWGKGPDDLAALAALQARLLDKAADLVRPGGRLVYCVCSLEPEEGEDQAEAFLARRPDFSRAGCEPGELGITREFMTAAGDLRTAPDLWRPAAPGGRGGLDGFFALAAVRKNA